MQIWISARTDLSFLKIPCLLPDGATAAGCIPGRLKCAGSQKFELFSVLGGHSLHFQNEKFLCSTLWETDFPSQLSSRDRWASSLRAVGTEFTVHVFRDTTLPEKEEALMLWVVGYAIWPLLLLQKRQWLFVEYCI